MGPVLKDKSVLRKLSNADDATKTKERDIAEQNNKKFGEYGKNL